MGVRREWYELLTVLQSAGAWCVRLVVCKEWKMGICAANGWCSSRGNACPTTE